GPLRASSAGKFLDLDLRRSAGPAKAVHAFLGKLVHEFLAVRLAVERSDDEAIIVLAGGDIAGPGFEQPAGLGRQFLIFVCHAVLVGAAGQLHPVAALDSQPGNFLARLFLGRQLLLARLLVSSRLLVGSLLISRLLPCLLARRRLPRRTL